MPESIARPAPDDPLGLIGGQPRGVQMIGVQVDQPLAGAGRSNPKAPVEHALKGAEPSSLGVDLGDGSLVRPHIGPFGSAGEIGLGDEMAVPIIWIYSPLILTLVTATAQSGFILLALRCPFFCVKGDYMFAVL